MAFINFLTRNIALKIVYYGPGLSGKTTNLKYLYMHLNPNSRGELVCLETDTNRTFFFDLLPVKAGLIKDFQTHFHLYTIPGQIFYEISRKHVLKGVDGIVFVADSQASLFDANIESFDNLRKYLMEHNRDIFKIPIVFQYNKRDLKNIIPIETLNKVLNPYNYPYIEAIAIQGVGVFDTLKEIARLTLPLVKNKVLNVQEEKAESTDYAEEVEIEYTEKPSVKIDADKIELVEEKKVPEKEVKIKKIRMRNFTEITRQLDELSRIYIGKSIFKKEKKWRLSDKRKLEFQKELDKEIERARRNREKLMVSALDIDEFKKINRDWGIEGGDFVLKTLAEVIERNKRPYDLLFRYKNDEFILVLINVKEKHGIRIIKRIQNVINNKKIKFNNREKSITLSAGVYFFNPKDRLNALELVGFAEKALQKAKKLGKNQVVTY